MRRACWSPCLPLELSRLTTIENVAKHLEISWDVIKEIQQQDLEKTHITVVPRSHAADYVSKPSGSVMSWRLPGSESER